MASSDDNTSKVRLLHVTIVSATLVSSPRGATENDSDTYATVIWGRQQFSTKVAKGQGTLPAWNEKHAFDLDNNETEAQDLVIQIYAVNPAIPQLLAVARLPLPKAVEAGDETSLLSLYRPREGHDCGQLKVALKWESSCNTHRTVVSGAYGETQPSPSPSYPPPSTQIAASVYPQMSSYGWPPPALGDTAAHALAGLSIDKDRQSGYDSTQQPGSGPANSYPPSTNAGPYPSQGLPYLASPIGGVVTGSPYPPPMSAYTHPPPFDNVNNGKSDTDHSPSAYPNNYPPYAPYAVNLPENLDVSGADKEKTNKSSYPPVYPGSPASHSEGYPPAHSPNRPNLPEMSKGNQVYPIFSQYQSHPQAESYDGQRKQTTKTDSDPSSSELEAAPTFHGSYPPHSNAGYPPSATYPPLSGQQDPSASPFGYPSQQTVQHNSAPEGYPVQQDIKYGEQKSESGEVLPSLGQGSAEGSADKKGFHLGYDHGYGYPQHGHAQHGYAQPGYGQPVYPQPGHSPYGYVPSYPPAYPGHGYVPEAYPSHQGYGAPGLALPFAHGGHSHHASAPYAATHGYNVGYGAPSYGKGYYKQHKGGHKGYKHKKMKKMKGHKGRYGYFGGKHGGHHGYGHSKHKYKH